MVWHILVVQQTHSHTNGSFKFQESLCNLTPLPLWLLVLWRIYAFNWFYMRFSDGFWLQSSISVVYCHSTAAIIPHTHTHIPTNMYKRVFISFALMHTSELHYFSIQTVAHFTHNNDDAYFPSTEAAKGDRSSERVRERERKGKGPPNCIRENYFLCFDIRRHTLLRTFYWNNDENLLNWLHRIKYVVLWFYVHKQTVQQPYRVYRTHKFFISLALPAPHPLSHLRGLVCTSFFNS